MERKKNRALAHKKVIYSANCANWLVCWWVREFQICNAQLSFVI